MKMAGRQTSTATARSATTMRTSEVYRQAACDMDMSPMNAIGHAVDGRYGVVPVYSQQLEFEKLFSPSPERASKQPAWDMHDWSKAEAILALCLMAAMCDDPA